MSSVYLNYDKSVSVYFSVMLKNVEEVSRLSILKFARRLLDGVFGFLNEYSVPVEGNNRILQKSAVILR